MKPFEESYRIFTILGICPPEKSIKRSEKWFNIFVSILCPTLTTITWTASIVFVKKYFSTDLATTICAFTQVAAGVTALYALIIAHLKRDNLKKNFESFQCFCDTSKLQIFQITNK